jgi:hypothetical protein
MHINSKTIHVETALRIRGVGMKASSEGGEFKYDIFDTLYIITTFVNVTMYPHQYNNKKNTKQKYCVGCFKNTFKIGNLMLHSM